MRTKTGHKQRWPVLPHAKVVDAFEGGAADPADDGVAIPAHQRVGHSLAAGRAIQLGWLVRHGYFDGSIESTLIVFVLSSSVPVTVTFFATNLAGAFWSVSL